METPSRAPISSFVGLSCKFCSKVFSGVISYSEHLQSMKHRKKEQAAKSIPAAEEGGHSAAKFSCKDCNLHCSGFIPLQQHLSCRKHVRRTQLAEIFKQDLQLSPDLQLGLCFSYGKIFQCNFCNAQLMGLESVFEHVNSVKHAKSLVAANKIVRISSKNGEVLMEKWSGFQPKSAVDSPEFLKIGNFQAKIDEKLLDQTDFESKMDENLKNLALDENLEGKSCSTDTFPGCKVCGVVAFSDETCGKEHFKSVPHKMAVAKFGVQEKKCTEDNLKLNVSLSMSDSDIELIDMEELRDGN